MSKDILYVLDEVPYPMTNGGRVDFYYAAKNFKDLGGRVYLVFWYTSEVEFESFLKIKNEICTGYIAFPRHRKRVSDFFSLIPYILLNRRSTKELLSAIEKKIGNNQIDLVISANLNAQVLASEIRDALFPRAKFVLRMHNIEFNLLWSTYKAMGILSIRKYFFMVEAIKMFFYEKKVYDRISAIAAISTEECIRIQQSHPKSNVFWVPPFFDDKPQTALNRDENHQFELLSQKLDGNLVILLTGNYSGGMTVRETQWFLREVLPKIYDQLESVHVVIAGRSANEYFSPSSNVSIIPNYTSVKPLMKRAQLFVVLATGKGGVKLKLMEALAYRKRVVSSLDGVYGSGLELFIPNSDSAERFAANCVDALNGRVNYDEVFNHFNNEFNCVENAKRIVNV